MVTEEKARTMWCPHARVDTLGTDWDHAGTTVGVAACNRAEERKMHEKPNCIASECMAWRWGQPPRETMRNYHDAPVVKPTPGRGVHDYPAGWQYEHTDADRNGRKFDLLHRLPADDAPRVGYCGAFGKPEV